VPLVRGDFKWAVLERAYVPADEDSAVILTRRGLPADLEPVPDSSARAGWRTANPWAAASVVGE